VHIVVYTWQYRWASCDLLSLFISWLPTPFASFPYTSPPVRHRVPSGFNWILPISFVATADRGKIYRVRNVPDMNLYAETWHPIKSTIVLPSHYSKMFEPVAYPGIFSRGCGGG
jgi:hypothetical protein